jgi:threonine/homoserine/homoserine lactone efflux protein
LPSCRSSSIRVWLQFLILGTVVNLAFSSADVVTVLAASTVMRRLRTDGLSHKLVRYGGGSILVGLGARLALDRT